MNRKLTAALLILAAVLANVAFTALGSIFNYPDVLDEPAGDVLASFRDARGRGQRLVHASSRSPPRCSRRSRSASGGCRRARAMRIAVRVGIAAAVVQVIGLLRWPILVPGYAADGRRATRSRTASDILGTAIGETLGYLLTATVDGARHRRARPALRRPLVRGARRRVRGAGVRRRVLAARPAGRRHRQLLRLRALEPLADRLRRRAPGARASAARAAAAVTS